MRDEQPVKTCEAFGLKTCTIPPAKVKWGDEILPTEQELLLEEEERRLSLKNRRDALLTEFFGCDDYNTCFDQKIPGNDPKVAVGSMRRPKLPLYRADSDFNRIYSEWRRGGDVMKTMSLTIDDIIFAGADLPKLTNSHLEWLRGHDDFSLFLEFDEKGDSISTKATVIGFDLDFERECLRVKSDRIKSYTKYWKNLMKEADHLGTISVMDFTKLVGRLQFAATLDEWKMYKVDPFLRAMKKVFVRYDGFVEGDWDSVEVWKTFRKDQNAWRVQIDAQMVVNAEVILKESQSWHPSLGVVLREHDGPGYMQANTDASNTAIGGMIHEGPRMRMWMFDLQNEDSTWIFKEKPLARRLIPVEGGGMYNTAVDISCLEFLAVCVQVDLMLEDRRIQKHQEGIITLTGDNQSVISALNKKRSRNIKFQPFLDWLFSRLGHTRLRLRSVHWHTMHMLTP